MYVSMYVCMYVRTCLCMYPICECLSVCMHVLLLLCIRIYTYSSNRCTLQLYNNQCLSFGGRVANILIYDNLQLNEVYPNHRRHSQQTVCIGRNEEHVGNTSQRRSTFQPKVEHMKTNSFMLRII